jgi:hypothetical protein
MVPVFVIEVPIGEAALSLTGFAKKHSKLEPLNWGVRNSTSYSTNNLPILLVSAQSVVAMKKLPESYNFTS